MIFFKSRCYNGGAQHRFEPRLTRENQRIPPVIQNSGRGYDGQELIGIVEASTRVHTKQTYHGDVCVWCGKMVKP